MALKGVEGIIDELKTELQANLPARVTALAAEPPALTMPAITEYAFGDRTNFLAYPAIAIEGDESPVGMDAGQRLRFLHRLSIRLYVQQSDEENLRRLLFRYTRAVVETLIDRRNASAFTFLLEFDGESWRYSPVRGPELGLFARDARLPVVCKRTEMR